MNLAEIFFPTLTAIALILILCQKVTVRIILSQELIIEIEYFPAKLILYNFGKKPKQKKKHTLIKRLKILTNLSTPTLSAIRFLLKRSDVQVPSYSIRHNSYASLHREIILRELERLGFLTLYLQV